MKKPLFERFLLRKAELVKDIACRNLRPRGPFKVMLELSAGCNTRCLHCYCHSPLLEHAAGQTRTPTRGEPLPHSRILEVIEELPTLGVKEVILTGDGEPFLHPGLFDLVRRIKSQGLYCETFTNGLVLTRGGTPALQELLDSGLDKVLWSLHATDAATYQEIHPDLPPETFARMLEALQLLRDTKRVTGRGPRLKLVHTVFRQNHHQLEAMAQQALWLGAEEIQFLPFNDSEEAVFAPLLLEAAQAAAARAALGRAEQLLDRAGLEHNIRHFLAVFEGRLCTRALYEKIPCYYGWIGCNILHDGDVIPCCQCTRPLGNLQHSTLQEVWLSGAFLRFRQESLELPRRGIYPAGCRCSRCATFVPNVRLSRLLGRLQLF